MGKHKISVLNYIKNNRRRVAVLVVSLGLAMAMNYCMEFFLSTSTETMNNVLCERSEKLQFIYNEEYSVSGLADDLRAVDGVDYALPCSAIYPLLTPPIGQISFDTPLVSAEEAVIIMDYMGATLKEGKLPTEAGEVIIDEMIAKNMKLSIGDSIVMNDFTICGIAESDGYFAVGIDNGNYINYQVVILSKGKGVDYAEVCEGLEYDSEKLSVMDNKTDVNFYKTQVVDVMDFSSRIITFGTTLILGICLLAVFNMYLRDRHAEWCLYYSIGFSAREIYSLIIRELLATYAMAVVLGTAVSTAVVIAIKNLMMDPIGVMSLPFSPAAIIRTVSIVILIFGILQLPVIYAINKIKTIDAIEEEEC